MHAKMANQIMVAVHLAALAEALAYGKRAGLDLHVLVDILKSGRAGSEILEVNAPGILDGNLEEIGAMGPMTLLHKDLECVIEGMAEMGVERSLSHDVREMYCRLIEEDRGKRAVARDCMGLIYLYQDRFGVEVIRDANSRATPRRRPPSAGLRGRKSGAVGPPPQGSGDRAHRRALPPDRTRIISMADTRVTTFSRTAEKSRTSWLSNQLKDERILGYVLLVPAFLLIVVFIAYPFVLGARMSLTDKVVGQPGAFIGLATFAKLLDCDIFRTASWNTVFFAISFLAALQTVPTELYDAAEIDGASGWRKFWNVTLPMIKPVAIVVVVFSFVVTFADFQLVYVLTRGGPHNSTHLLATLGFQLSIHSGSLGEGAAAALFMVPLLFVVVLQLTYLRRVGVN